LGFWFNNFFKNFQILTKISIKSLNLQPNFQFFKFCNSEKFHTEKKAHHQGRSHGAPDNNKLLENFWERKGGVDVYKLLETFWRIAPPTQTKIKILTWHQICYIFGTIVVHNGKFDILVLNNYVISKIKIKNIL